MWRWALTNVCRQYILFELVSVSFKVLIFLNDLILSLLFPTVLRNILCDFFPFRILLGVMSAVTFNGNTCIHYEETGKGKHYPKEVHVDIIYY